MAKKNGCFACGNDNPGGMHLKFIRDDQNRTFTSHVILSSRYQGPPQHAHGGVIATLLDEAMSKVNSFTPGTALTRRITVDYLRPVPLGKEIIVQGWKQRRRGRHFINRAEIKAPSGELLARGRGWFIGIDAGKMFPGLASTELRAAARRS